MKKKLLIIMLVSILLSGCLNMNTPKKKVESLLMSYQSNSDNIIKELDNYLSNITTSESDFEDYKRVYSRQYQNLTYEIKDETINGDEASVTAQIDVYDYYKVNLNVEEYLTNHPDEFYNNGIYDTKEALKYRINELSNTKERITYTIVITLTKVNNKWEIDNISEDVLEKIHGTYAH